jgi:hypothetical protein
MGFSRWGSTKDKTRLEIKTQPWLAKKIVDYLSPQFKVGDFFCDPCAGDDAFYNCLPPKKMRCEIKDGTDWLTAVPPQPIDWVITNFPWSGGGVLRPMLKKAYQQSANVAHLIRLHNILGVYSQYADMAETNHVLKEIIIMPWTNAFFDKAREGFCLAVIHSQRNYTGDCRFTQWKD